MVGVVRARRPEPTWFVTMQSYQLLRSKNDCEDCEGEHISDIQLALTSMAHVNRWNFL